MRKLWGSTIRLIAGQAGQSTTEYALVLLAVVALAGVLNTVGVKGMTEFLTGVFAKLATGIK
ncbi:MAG: DUF4244 domain-containing protein [Actinomycetota bacterium]